MKDKVFSKLAGFIDGYKASNIANYETSLKFHLNEIEQNVSSLLDDIQSNNISIGCKDVPLLLSRADNILRGSSEDYLKTITEFSEALKTIIFVSHKHGGCCSSVLDDNRVKRIIYHLVESAEKIGDKYLTDLIINLGNSI